MPTVQWPAQPVSAIGDDLATPAKNLLKDLGLIGKQDPSASDAHTPESLQVIQAGSLAFSRSSAKIIAGLSALTASGGLLSQLGNLDLALRLVIIGSVALVLAAGALAVAMIITADVRCRAAASVARTESLAKVAVAFLEGSAAMARPEPQDTHVANLRPSDPDTTVRCPLASIFGQSTPSPTSVNGGDQS